MRLVGKCSVRFEPPGAENRMSGGVGGVTGDSPSLRPDPDVECNTEMEVVER